MYTSPENSRSIKHWAREDKPREKLLDKGPQALTTAELLSIIIGAGNKNNNSLDLSRQVLKKANNDLKFLGRLSVQQLISIPGIGRAKATMIGATMELRRRRLSGDIEPGKTHFNSTEEVALYMKPKIGHLIQEQFYVLYLSNNNRLIHLHHLSAGGMSATIVDPKLVYREAISRRARRLYFCHNHPSGSLQASHADICLTRTLKEAGAVFKIEVLDHVIVSDRGFCSMFDEGLM